MQVRNLQMKNNNGQDEVHNPETCVTCLRENKLKSEISELKDLLRGCQAWMFRSDVEWEFVGSGEEFDKLVERIAKAVK